MEHTKGEQCCKQVCDSAIWHSYQCRKKSVVIRDGKPYCKIHDPEYKKKKNEEKRKKWDKEWKEKKALWHRREVTGKVFEGIETSKIENNINVYKNAPKLLEALKRIANNEHGQGWGPKQIAEEALKLEERTK